MAERWRTPLSFSVQYSFGFRLGFSFLGGGFSPILFFFFGSSDQPTWCSPVIFLFRFLLFFSFRPSLRCVYPPAPVPRRCGLPSFAPCPYMRSLFDSFSPRGCAPSFTVFPLFQRIAFPDTFSFQTRLIRTRHFFTPSWLLCPAPQSGPPLGTRRYVASLWFCPVPPVTTSLSWRDRSFPPSSLVAFRFFFFFIVGERLRPFESRILLPLLSHHITVFFAPGLIHLPSPLSFFSSKISRDISLPSALCIQGGRGRGGNQQMSPLFCCSLRHHGVVFLLALGMVSSRPPHSLPPPLENPLASPSLKCFGFRVRPVFRCAFLREGPTPCFFTSSSAYLHFPLLPRFPSATGLSSDPAPGCEKLGPNWNCPVSFPLVVALFQLSLAKKVSIPDACSDHPIGDSSFPNVVFLVPPRTLTKTAIKVVLLPFGFFPLSLATPPFFNRGTRMKGRK